MRPVQILGPIIVALHVGFMIFLSRTWHAVRLDDESDPRMVIHDRLSSMAKCGHYRPLNRADFSSYCVRIWQHPTINNGVSDRVLLVFRSQVTENCHYATYIVDNERHRFVYCCISTSSMERILKSAEDDFGMIEHSTDDVVRYWPVYFDGERLDDTVRRPCPR